MAHTSSASKLCCTLCEMLLIDNASAFVNELFKYLSLSSQKMSLHKTCFRKKLDEILYLNLWISQVSMCVDRMLAPTASPQPCHHRGRQDQTFSGTECLWIAFGSGANLLSDTSSLFFFQKEATLLSVQPHATRPILSDLSQSLAKTRVWKMSPRPKRTQYHNIAAASPHSVIAVSPLSRLHNRRSLLTTIMGGFFPIYPVQAVHSSPTREEITHKPMPNHSAFLQTYIKYHQPVDSHPTDLELFI